MERNLSGELSGPRLLSCQQERGCQDSEMTSAKRIKKKWHHQTRMSREGGKDVQTNRRQPEDLSRFRNVRSRESGSIRFGKKCQGPRLPRDHAVDGRASQAVRGRSYKLSLFFIGFSSLETSVARLVRALLVYSIFYMYNNL